MGWTGHQFDKLVRDGLPVAERPSGRGTDYVLFMGDVIRWLLEQELKALGHETTEAAKLDLNAERARLAKEQADKTELENKLARGELVRAQDVTKTYETVFSVLRDRILQVVSVAPLLHDAAINDGLPKVRSVLRTSLTDALEGVGAAQVNEIELDVAV